MQCPGVIVITPCEFRKDMFPAFPPNTEYSDERIVRALDEATLFISDMNCGRLRDNARRRAIEYMAAHLLTLEDKAKDAQAGAGTGLVASTSASIDKVSVTTSYVAPPVNNNEFDYWLNLTLYGQKLLALLKLKSAAGLMVGGSKPWRSIFNGPNR